MEQLGRKADMATILDGVIQYAIDSYIFYYDSMESYYCRKEPSLKRKIKFYLTFLLLTIFIFKYGLLSLYPDKLLLVSMKDASIELGDQATPAHALLFIIGLVTTFGKLVMVYYERRSKLEIFNMIVGWKAGQARHTVNQQHERTLTIRAFFLYYVYIRFFGFVILTVFSFCIISITMATHLYGFDGNVIILWLWSLLVIMAIDQGKTVLMIGTFMFYVPIMKLNYRLDEMIMKLRVAIRWNNEKTFNEALDSYEKLIEDVGRLSGPYNMIIGLTYCIVPYLIAINVQLLKIKRDDLLFRILKNAFLLLFFGAILDTFLINQISASITVRNKSIPRYLYPMFCSQRNRRTRMKLKVDSFVAQLNSQFVGFYCFNLFEFTKMAFYQYAITISSSYFLLSNFFRK